MSKIVIAYYGREVVDNDWKINLNTMCFKLYYVFNGYSYYNGKKLVKDHLYIFQDKGNIQSPGEKFDHIYFDFFITPLMSFNDIIDIDLNDYPEIKNLLHAFGDIFDKYGNPKSKDGLAKRFLDTLLYLVNDVCPIRIYTSDLIYNSLKYIEENFDKDINIKDIADSVHIDRYYFIKLFKKEVGTTPYQYIKDLKLTRSIEFLKSGKSINETALLSGYGSAESFSNVFQKKFNMRPSEYQSIAKNFD